MQIERLWQVLAELHASESIRTGVPRVLPILGPSGSGKSSLARAGLIAKLKRHALPCQGEPRFCIFTPGSRPLETLAGVLARLATGDSVPAAKAAEFEQLLRQQESTGASEGLRRIVDLLPDIATSPLVMLIDQFEEVFSLCPDETERKLFIDNLLVACADRSGRSASILTLRSDFLGETQDHPLLNQIVSDRGVIVPAMSDDELRAAIAEPARKAGHPLDEATVDLLLSDSRGHEGALPLLQFALTRIWEGLRNGRAPATTLHEIGGVGGALAGEAQRIYDSLTEDEQRVARRAFLAMIQLGEGTKDTRRRARLADLVTGGDDLRKIRNVLSKFAEAGARLVTLSADQGAGPARQADVAEVTHEALFEHWQSLRQWIDRSRDDIRFHRRLEEAAHRWQENQRPRGMLWRTPDLDLLRKLHARSAADFSVLENEFRRECERLVKRERFTKLAVVSAICVACVVAIVFWRLAEWSRNKAEIAERTALSLASTSSAETGVLRLRGAIAESNFDPFGLLHLARARTNAEGDTAAVARTSQLWSGWRDDLGNRLVQVVGHEGPVVDVAIHPGGKLFATASLDKTAGVWDLATGKPLVEGGLKHAAAVGLVAFSPDGKWLATASHDGEVRLWSDTSHFKQSVGLHASPASKAHRDRVQAIAFSPNADLLATGSRDGRIRLWSLPTGKLVHEFDDAAGQVSSVAFDSSGTLLAALSSDQSSVTLLRLWKRGSSENEWQPQGTGHSWPTGQSVGQISTKYGIAFRPDRPGSASLVAVHGSAAELCDRDSKGRDRDKEIFSHGNVVWAARFSPDGRLVASAGADDVCKVLQLSNAGVRAPVYRLETRESGPLSFADEPARIVHDGDVRAVAFSPDSRMLATASWDQTVRLYDVDFQEQRLVQRGRRLQHFGKLWALEFIPNGKYLITASDDGTARVWDCEPELGTHLVHDAPVNGQAISPDGKLIATYSEDKTARLWQVPHGETVSAPLVHRSPVTHAAWDSNSRVLATTSRDGTISIWSTDGNLLNEFRSDEAEPASYIRFVSKDRLLAVAIGRMPLQNSYSRGTMRVWEIVRPTAKTGECRLLSQASKDYLPQEHFARAFAFDTDGNRIARVDGKNILVCMLDARMTELAQFAHDNLVTDVVFHPGGRLLLSGGWDGAGRIWDLQSKAAAARALDHGKGVMSMALSGNGRFFVTGCEDRFVRVWNTDTWQLVCPPLRHRPYIQEVAVDFEGQTVAVRSNEHTNTVWQTATGHPLREIQLSALAQESSLQFTPNADSLACVLNDHTSLILAFGAAPNDPAEMEMETQLLLGAELDSTGRTVSPIPWRAWQNLHDRLYAINPIRSETSAPGERMHRSRGIFFLHRKDWQAAVWHFGQLVDKQPNDLDARFNRARAYNEGEQYERALADLESLMPQREDDVEVLKLYVTCCENLKRWESAAEHLERLARIAVPPNQTARTEMAKTLIDVGSRLLESSHARKALGLFRIANAFTTVDNSTGGNTTSAALATMHVAHVRACAGVVRCLAESAEDQPDKAETAKVSSQATAALQESLVQGGLDRLMDLADDPNISDLSERDADFRAVWSQSKIQQEIAARRLVESLRQQLMDMSAVQSAIRSLLDLDPQTRNRALELAQEPTRRVTPAEVLKAARRRALTRDLPVADYDSATKWLTRVRSNNVTDAFHRQAVMGMLAYRAGNYDEAERLLSQALEFAPEREWAPVYSLFAAMASAQQRNLAASKVSILDRMARAVGATKRRNLAGSDQAMMELPPDYLPPSDSDLLASVSAEAAELSGKSTSAEAAPTASQPADPEQR